MLIERVHRARVLNVATGEVETCSDEAWAHFCDRRFAYISRQDFGYCWVRGVGVMDLDFSYAKDAGKESYRTQPGDPPRYGEKPPETRGMLQYLYHEGKDEMEKTLEAAVNANPDWMVYTHLSKSSVRFWNDFSPGLKRLTYHEDALSLIFCESDDKTVRLSNTF